MLNQAHLFQTKRFLPLFITQFLGAFNDNIFKNALVLWLTYAFAESNGYQPQVLVAVAAGLFILPFFLFSATAGQLADKYDKARLIRKLKFIEILLMILAAVGFFSQNEVMLLTVLFLTGTQAAFFGPVKYSILPDQLAETELLGGNGIIEAGTFIAILLGTILGGILIGSPHAGLWLTSFLITIAIAGWISSWYIPLVPSSNTNLTLNKNIIQESWNIVKSLKYKKSILLSVLGISWIWFVGATFIAQFPLFAKVTLKANEHVVTLFLVVFSIGIAMGSILCNRLLKGTIKTTYLPISALCITLFSTDLYFVSEQFSTLNAGLLSVKSFILIPASIRLLLDLLLIAVACGVYMVPLYSILQSKSTPSRRSQIIAGNNIVNALFMVLSAVAVGVMLGLHFKVSHIFLMVALANIAVFIYLCKLLPKALLKSILAAILQFAYHVKVQGLENYEKAGQRVVIIANHTSFLDVVLLAVFLPDEITFAVNTDIAKQWWLRPLLSFVAAFPLDPTNPMAIKSLIEHIKTNKRCLIFPEGRLTVTGTLMKIYEGPGLIADKSNSPLLPIRIEGAQYTPFSRLKGKVRINFFPKITITILPPQFIAMPAEITGRERRQLIGMKLHDIMTEMMFMSSNPQRTLYQSLLDASAIHGHKHVVVQDVRNTKLTYGKLILASFIFGKQIAKVTLTQECVGILLPNIAGAVVVFFAMQATGRIPVMLNFSAGSQNLLSACETAKVKHIYSSRKFIVDAKLMPVIDSLVVHGVEVHYLEDIQEQLSIIDKLRGFMLSIFPEFAYDRLNNITKETRKGLANKPAVVLFTSGSEGKPKGVVLSHQNLQANRYQLSSCVDFNTNDKIFNALPLFHSFGLTAGTLLPILSGMLTYLYPSPLHYRIIPELIYGNNATILFGTDTFLANYAKYAHGYDFYSVRYVFAGAEKLRDVTRKLLTEKLGIRIFEGYGVTEASPVIACNTPMKNKPGSVGRFMPGLSYKVDSVPNIPRGGRLWVSGPNVMLGYLLADQPGEIKPLVDGWHDTGDIVEVDDQGYVFIKGRAKRFAKIAGEMISLTAVEQSISDLWPNDFNAVVNIPDEKKGEQLVLVTTYADAKREQINAHFKEKGISELGIPREIIVVEKMPLLPTGKTDYQKVLELVTLAL